MANADPGYDVKNIISVALKGADYKLLSHDIAQLKGVESISAASDNLGRGASGSIAIKQSKDKEPILTEYYDVDKNFINNMRLTLVAGNTFEDNTIDKEKQVMISETLQKILQFKTPAEAVGKMILINDTTMVQIAGVTKDFYYRGLETPYGPLVFRNRPQEFKYLHVKYTAANDKAIVASIESVWKKTNPHKPFEGDNLYNEIHGRKEAWGTVSMLGFLAVITITLACMGLLGMVVYNTETRKKEIGIRKVMGASVSGMITLLSKSFMRLVLIAGVIALPVSYALSYFFLNIFANRINIGFGILASSFFMMLLMSLITIGSHIYKVAIANPVESLRTE